MGIRIDRIERKEMQGGYRWIIRIKGLHGQGVYVTLFTGDAGKGLYYVEDDLLFFDWLKADAARVEVLPCERFYVHEGCTAEDVVHRVAAVLVAIGWGPEIFDDRDSISGKSRAWLSRLDDRTAATARASLMPPDPGRIH